MVNWQSPSVVAADSLAFVKLLHVLAGLFMWEFFATLQYEWDFVKKRRPYRWTIWIYSATRITALMNVILGLVGFNVTKPIACEVWLIFEFIFAYTAFSLASLLIVLRLIAIWNRNVPISLLAVGVWLVNLAFLLRSVIVARSEWDNDSGGCQISDTDDSRINVTVTLITDTVLLTIMIVGLRRQRDHELGRMLFNQGVLWLCLATISEVPPVVFLWLNLNDPLNIVSKIYFTLPAV
ncbi:hypothetical protein BV25DRAFT_1914609 [Artomyces pyxidatus]|uniref:Uncharacterized protein n=1 Tax=Artomyces pyxidatus TaxID=48021 RepID=A0ACB8T8D7_9AGAM|nr:hypothetical protein BV25DRAFT_1914609 [Artomyces pyxidatus]